MKKFLVITGLLLSPSVAFAISTPETFGDLIGIFIDLILLLLPIVMGIALLVFFWGLAKFILRAGEETGREEGKEVMKWGIIGLFVAVSLFGILTFFYNDFGFNSDRPFGVPTLPTGMGEMQNMT